MKTQITGLVAAIVALLGVVGVPVTEEETVTITAGVTTVVAIGFAVYRLFRERRAAAP